MARLNWYSSNLMACIEYTIHGVVPDHSSLDLRRIGAFTLSFMPGGNHQMARLNLYSASPMVCIEYTIHGVT